MITRNAQLYEEPLVFERSRPGKEGVLLPEDDQSLADSLDENFVRPLAELRLPELAESEVVRHFSRLSTWNYAIDLNTYPLGSCTMKYNPRINEEIAAFREYAAHHPGLPERYSQHILRVTFELQEVLKALTDMHAVTLQPAAGAHGELTGLFLIAAALRQRGEKRTIMLIPDSAHGTNPASCRLAGFEALEIRSTADGLTDLDSLKAQLGANVAGLMLTNPSTLGVFERNIRPIADLLHASGAFLYMDGANFNAILGKASLSAMGVDVCHLNLHKTFSTPHGGGGPGAGAVVVAPSLAPFLPGPLAARSADGHFFWSTPEHSIGRVKAGIGHFGMMLRALTYINSYGRGIDEVADQAVLNARYLLHLLKNDFAVASPLDMLHEAVLSDRLQKETNFSTMDLAKALIDYGFHPPTVYFPLSVSGAMMIEPTETESADSIRELCAALIDIARRMREGDASLKEAPRRAFVGRLDEVEAARSPVLNFFTAEGENI
ncbi:MAG: aminomethyl-transferring glycine dehydrogenase subunit GcvPB [Spirochaetales bacterium]|nr:aminomethyl-transferring glycine dehydrogenase subunit GcvPB [Spirochaetales bacterium]